MNARAASARRAARSPQALRAQLGSDLVHRRRELVTPEGLSLPLTIASRGARAGALMLDLIIVFVGLAVLVVVLLGLGIGFLNLSQAEESPAVELLVVVLIVGTFLARYFYFIGFELSPRGATPGKRIVGIRVAARPNSEGSGGRLTAEAVIASNLMRDVEVFLPLTFLLSDGFADGVVGIAAGIWLGMFLLFPFLNRDFLRAGDLVAGTWVVEAERSRLTRALSLGTTPPTAYRFGPDELAVYGEHELQVLEGVLRTGNAEAQREVMEAICRKIGWEAGAQVDGIGDERAFLEAFYAAQRAHLERGLRFGRRKTDKFG